MIESVLDRIPKGMGYWRYQAEIAWCHVNLVLPMDVFGRSCSSLSRRRASSRSAWPVSEIEDMILTVTHVELNDSRITSPGLDSLHLPESLFKPSPGPSDPFLPVSAGRIRSVRSVLLPLPSRLCPHGY